MRDLLNVYLFAETNAANSEAVKQNLAQLAQQAQVYINIILGSFASLLVLLIAIIISIAWFKAGKADSDEERALELKKVKWLVAFFGLVILLWGVSGILTQLLQLHWKA
ncbi:hypothetical protein MZO39_01390 [Mycoplasma capricolum subsp. capricolum]|uniref:Mbov_0395 family pilin-like conjugal transfer protein n=1 Tax=Mycoplasma capricolum TaxID=2095 RepID=UPI0020C0F5E4|nr:hypothetical protein [Mycoplasma capricolum]MCK8461674.1 hypothetical protein [Mycoplasma capricolum subsp. capricolum]